MKKVILTICGAVLLAASLAGCCMKHEWAEATCTEPKKCVKCGETEGVANGHKWKAATCTTPKTCETCGKTEGEALGHTWVDRTMEKPKTCSVCGATEGSPIVFKEVLFPIFDANNYKSILFLPETIVCTDVDRAVMDIYDYSQKQVKQINLNPAGRETRSFGYDVYLPTLTKYDGLIITTDVDEEKNCTISFYDQRGEELATVKKKIAIPDGAWLEVRAPAENRYLRFYANTDSWLASVKPRLVIDCETWTEIPVEDCPPIPWFSNNDFAAVSDIVYCDKYCMAWSLDGKKMYYVHPKYYSIKAEYDDLSSFNRAGFAMVSKDGVSYDIIDTDLNVVAEGIMKGTFGRVSYHGENIFCLPENRKLHFYSIE